MGLYISDCDSQISETATQGIQAWLLQTYSCSPPTHSLLQHIQLNSSLGDGTSCFIFFYTFNIFSVKCFSSSIIFLLASHTHPSRLWTNKSFFKTRLPCLGGELVFIYAHRVPHFCHYSYCVIIWFTCLSPHDLLENRNFDLCLVRPIRPTELLVGNRYTETA